MGPTAIQPEPPLEASPTSLLISLWIPILLVLLSSLCDAIARLSLTLVPPHMTPALTWLWRGRLLASRYWTGRLNDKLVLEQPPSKTWREWLWLLWTSFLERIFWYSALRFPDQPLPEASAKGTSTTDPRPESRDLPPLHKCTCSDKGRNLVVCIDGTSNQFSINNTNVVELYSRLVKDDSQLTYYNSGIGTYAAPSWKSFRYYQQVFENKLDLAFALNFERILLSAYLWLSENYRPGDRIFLFGFSRGAYQVRGLAAMIDQVGLIHKGNQDQIPFAFQLYAETKKIKNIEKMRAHFKKTFSHKDVCIHYAGLWDTVSSVGLIRDKTLPGTTDGMRFICFVRHALALHDRRVKFLPEYVHGGDGPLEDEIETMDGKPPHTKEVWFAGSHGDVGGGSVDNAEMNRFGPALRWISFEAVIAGLRLSDAPQQWDSEVSEVHGTLTAWWKPLEWLPITRLEYSDHDKLTVRPHRGEQRHIRPHQRVHETAVRTKTDIPCADLPTGTSWKELIENTGSNREDLIEKDPYTAAQTILNDIDREMARENLPPALPVLKELISTEPGCISLRDSENAGGILVNAIARYAQTEAPLPQVLVEAALKVKLNPADYTGQEVSSVLDSMRKIRSVSEGKFDPSRTSEVIQRLEDGILPAQARRPIKHATSVCCVAYTPNGRHIVYGCGDGAVRLWDVDSGAIMGALMTGHTDYVRNVAVSADGSRIVSGSYDRTIRVWSAGTGETVAVLEGDSNWVFSVAISPDGSRVVSGSRDRTIRVWDVASGKTVVGPFHGHLVWANSVAYSADGSRIVSGSGDGMVHVWNAETGENLWRAQLSYNVLSVAFSPDGKRIVAGCENGTVCILDAETGEIVLGPLKGHSYGVNSVAFSLDGKRIASASDDCTVRLWNAETGQEIDVFRGHRHWVTSVAFSPDGTRVASASYDETVRFWDATRQLKSVQ